MLVSLFKELNLVSLPKKLLKKVIFVLLLASSSVAQALTLGDFVVDSFLDKPLKAEIAINGNSGDNLNTIEVSMATKEEFKLAGIVRSSALDDFDLKLVKGTNKTAKILVTTDKEVSDPYIHMLLKIRWNGGQLLREFTALIDPPLYSSQPAENIDTANTSKQQETNSTSELDTKASANQAGAAQQSITDTGSLADGEYGPVQAGESLSEIAVTIQKDNPDLSIYQIMYVLFQNNKSAFVNQNINGLAKGATLQVGNLNEIAQVDKKEGLNFFYSQVAEWSSAQGSQSTTSNDDVKIPASESVEQSSSDASVSDENETSTPTEASTASTQEPVSGEDESKPEFEVAGSDVQSGAQQSGENAQVVANLETKIAELEASFESSKLESDELKETIAILESQLADSNRLIEITNAEIAALTGNENIEDENEASIGITEPAAEEPAVKEPAAEEPAVKEPAAEEPEVEEPEVDEPEVDEPEVDEPEVDEPEVDEPEVDEPVSPPVISELDKLAPVSLLDTIINTIKDLWKFIAIGFVGILGLIFLKMRSSKSNEDDVDAFESTFTVYPENTGESSNEDEDTSDAKAEELINAIKAETTKPASAAIANSASSEKEISSDDSVVSSIDMDALREATQSVTDFEVDGDDEENLSKESSFLTVYNDGDVVVNADEIDPIAEADVYIAYGREDQGEEVLLDGVKNFPDRNDIKIALLGLYVKSSKRTEFDEIYKGLISAGVQNNIEEWQSVEELREKIDAKTGVSSDPAPANLDIATSPSDELLSTNNLNIDNEVSSNTDLIVNSEVDELPEIDIKSESFDISEIDFSTEVGGDPVLSNDDLTLEVESGIDLNGINQIDSSDLNIDSDTAEIESITITLEVDSPGEVSVNGINLDSSDEIDDVVNSLNDVDFTSATDNVSSIEKEISQIDFSDDMNLSAEQDLEIDMSNTIIDDSGAVDIGVEISEVSYNDEISLTDVMDLNVNDIDLANIPEEQDLTPVKDNAATTLVNESNIDFVDEMTIDNEVTIDLTQAMDFNDDGAAFGNIDLDLGQNSSDGQLPDGDNDPETQLDLAKVFLELDDVPGAVKILKELVDNDKVGEAAKELLANNT